MNDLLIRISNSHDRIFKVVMILIAIFGISYLLPHKVRYKFEVKKGKAWNYEDLVAPIDFAVMKHPDTLKAERDRVMLSVLPVFVVDSQISNSLASELIAQLSARSLGSANSNESIQRLTDAIYAKGVLTPSNESSASFSLVVNRELSSVSASDFINPTDASRNLSVALRNNLSKEIYAAITIPAALPGNINFDSKLTSQMRQERLAEILPTSGVVRQGELIISRGQPISNEKYLILQSLKEASDFREPDSTVAAWVFVSQMILVALALSMLVAFLARLRKDVFADNRKLGLILSLIILNVVLFTGIMKAQSLSHYLAPMCIMPIILRVFFDTRLALFAHMVASLILGFVAPGGFEFVYMHVIAGMVAIFSVTNLRRRAQLFISVGLILLAYVVSYSALSVIYEGGRDAIQLTDIYWLVGNVLLTLFAYPLIFIFEKIFGITSDVTLMELSDSNSPLLRELSIKAPGTFQHSMQVANLAEAAVFKIGGNALLVRTGALYHDIGKMDTPMYFIENQNSNLNPHDELSFDESAAIIIDHVIKGIEIARKNKLPDIVVDFIRTHHGTSMVQYFYQSFLKNYPEEIVNEDDFRYPGPLPFSRETAVLMMADSVEAASRSLSAPTSEAINALVDQVIESQIEAEQFVNCDITFRDITSIKKIFKKMLMSIYHVRVEYPTARKLST